MTARPPAPWTRRLLGAVASEPRRSAGGARLDDPDAWLLFGPLDGRLSPDLNAIVRREAERRPDIDLFYGDQVTGLGSLEERRRVRPDFDRTRLWAEDYVGLPLAIRASAFRHLGGFSPRAGAGSAYDLVLRAVAAGRRVERIDEVLVAVPGGDWAAPAQDRRMAVQRALRASGSSLETDPGDGEGPLTLRRRFDDPPAVTLVVSLAPGDDRHATAARLREVDWPADRLRLVFADAGPRSPLDAVRALNALWREADDHLVFLDGDLVVDGPGWLAALMTFAVDPGVGAVSGRLAVPEPDGLDVPAGGPPRLQHEVSSAVRTILACRKAVLEEVNGFDERLAAAYVDRDLCLRMRLLGHRIVHAPGAAFARAADRPTEALPPDPETTGLFLERWSGLLDHEARRAAPDPGQDMWWRRPV